MTKTHGLSRTKFYQVWTAMLQRCLNPKCTAYKNYGGRGITVCERWRTFENFLQDMNPGWRDGLTIERARNSGNYEPGNCRWATRKIQANNRRTNVTYNYKGKNYTIFELSGLCNFTEHLIRTRIWHGWSVEDAISLALHTVTHRPKGRNSGSIHGMSKLTENDVIKIRKMVDAGKTQCSIARIFNLTPSNVGYIVKRKTWTHI